MRRVVALVVVLAALLVPGLGRAESVMIAPEGVTWDGMTVRVLYGMATEIRIEFLEDGSTPPVVACTNVPAGSGCPWQSGPHGGQRVRVVAYGDDGSIDAFEVVLARHVELGRWSLQKLEDILSELQWIFSEMSAIPVEIVNELTVNLTVNPDSPGYVQLDTAVEGLQTAGVFGQVQQAVSEVQSAVDQLQANPPDWTNGPRLAGTPLDPEVSAVTPCEPGEELRLSFCIPMEVGLDGEKYYFRLDIPNHVAAYWDSYRRLFQAISWGIWVWFAAWLIRQFVPRLSA